MPAASRWIDRRQAILAVVVGYIFLSSVLLMGMIDPLLALLVSFAVRRLRMGGREASTE